MHRMELYNIRMISKILDVALLLRAKLSGNELDLALLAATNDDNWQAAPILLHAISSAAYSHEKWLRISEFLWSKLRNSSRWKKILKALNVVEFLLKNGPSFAVEDLRKEVAFFHALESFEADQEGVDRGSSIRDRARVVAGLLQNESLLEDERANAKLIRERMSHMAGTSSYGSQGTTTHVAAPKYESFSSYSLPKDADSNGFYNYGSGNYGDRQEEEQHQRQEEVPRRTQGGERRKREVVPIVLLDIKQRRVEVNPLYEVVQKRMKESSTEKRSSSETKIKREVRDKVERPPLPVIKPSKPAPIINQPQTMKIQPRPIEVVKERPIEVAKENPSPGIFNEDSSVFLLQDISVIPLKPIQAEIESPNKSTGLQLLYLNPFAPTPPPPQEQFTAFKNGGNFEIEKIGWLSNKQKNLTDLCDLEVGPPLPATQQKKEFTNNIKIDQWAW